MGAIWDGESEGGAKSGIVRIRKELRHAIAALAPDLQPDPTRQVDPVPQNKHGAYYLDPRLLTTDLEAFHRIEAAAPPGEGPCPSSTTSPPAPSPSIAVSLPPAPRPTNCPGSLSYAATSPGA